MDGEEPSGERTVCKNIVRPASTLKCTALREMLRCFEELAIICCFLKIILLPIEF